MTPYKSWAEDMSWMTFKTVNHDIFLLFNSRPTQRFYSSNYFRIFYSVLWMRHEIDKRGHSWKYGMGIHKAIVSMSVLRAWIRIVDFFRKKKWYSRTSRSLKVTYIWWMTSMVGDLKESNLVLKVGSIDRLQFDDHDSNLNSWVTVSENLHVSVSDRRIRRCILGICRLTEQSIWCCREWTDGSKVLSWDGQVFHTKWRDNDDDRGSRESASRMTTSEKAS
jgi:hypothetical protein